MRIGVLIMVLAVALVGCGADKQTGDNVNEQPSGADEPVSGEQQPSGGEQTQQPSGGEEAPADDSEVSGQVESELVDESDDVEIGDMF